MRTATLIIIILLLLSLVGNYIQYRSAERSLDDRLSENDRFQQKQEAALAEIGQKDSVISAVFDQLAKDSVRHAKDQGALKRVISSQMKRVEKRDVPILEDSIISNQEDLIADLENERDTLYLEGGPAVQKLDSINQELKSMVVSGLARQVDLRDRLREERAKKWSIGIGAGLDYRGKPTVALTMSRQIFRFSLKKR